MHAMQMKPGLNPWKHTVPQEAAGANLEHQTRSSLEHNSVMVQKKRRVRRRRMRGRGSKWKNKKRKKIFF